MLSASPPSRYAEYRKRKRAGGAVAAHRSAAELQRLALLPAAERTPQQQAAVRNARRAAKQKAARAARAVEAVSIEPAPRSATPVWGAAQEPADNPLLNTQDMEDIIGYPLAEAEQPAAAAVQPSLTVVSSHQSPPSQLFDYIHEPSPVPVHPHSPMLSPPPPLIAASAAAAAASDPSSVAAAASMSSASKLRAAIMNKRKNMPLLNPDVKRQELSKGFTKSVDDNENMATVEQEWENLIQGRAEQMMSIYLNKRKGEKVGEVHRARIFSNVRLWINTARARGCTGTEDGGLHAPGGCPEAFTPSSFLHSTQFAHWRKHKRSTSGQSPSADKLYNVILRSSCAQFAQYIAGADSHGRVLWDQCHHVESRQQMKASTM